MIGDLVRDPLRLEQWDDSACEVACMAQLLWMAGKLEEKQIRYFDRKIGRTPGEPDMEYGGLRAVFKAGFRVESIGEHPLDEFLGADGRQKREVHWRRKGRDLKQLAKVHDLLEYHARQLYELCKSYRRQFKGTVRVATAKDLKEALQHGKVVGVVEDHGDGYSHYMLALPHDKNVEGRCRLYDPDDGAIVDCSIVDVMKLAGKSLDIYTFPRT